MPVTRPCRGKSPRAAIDKLGRSSLNEFAPHESAESDQLWSRAVVTRSGRNNPFRVLMLTLPATACLLVGVSPARATGCHVPERPVLAHTLSWERWQRDGSAPAGVRPSPIAPALHPLPCQGEIPAPPSLAAASSAPALAAVPGLEPPAARVERVTIDPPARIPPPFASRLDRPPRPIHAGLGREG
jgi:hypothetical protein